MALEKTPTAILSFTIKEIGIREPSVSVSNLTKNYAGEHALAA